MVGGLVGGGEVGVGGEQVRMCDLSFKTLPFEERLSGPVAHVTPTQCSFLLELSRSVWFAKLQSLVTYRTTYNILQDAKQMVQKVTEPITREQISHLSNSWNKTENLLQMWEVLRYQSLDYETYNIICNISMPSMLILRFVSLVYWQMFVGALWILNKPINKMVVTNDRQKFQ